MDANEAEEPKSLWDQLRKEVIFFSLLAVMLWSSSAASVAAMLSLVSAGSSRAPWWPLPFLFRCLMSH